MIKNYLKTALRLMLRQKAYSAINIVGLSLGIAASLMITLYVVDELSFDKFQKDGDRMYRIGFSGRMQGNDFAMAQSPVPVANGLMEEIPGIESAVKFMVWPLMPVVYGEKALTINNFAVADSNFFKFFSFPLVQGDVESLLKGTNKIAISESTAKQFFGNDNPIGKILVRGSDKKATEVTGVFKDIPENSHFRVNAVLSIQSEAWINQNQGWTSNNVYTYFKINPGTNIEKMKADIHAMAEKHIGPELEKYIGLTMKQFRAAGNSVGLFTQYMPDIHLHSNLQAEIAPNGNVQYLFIFGAIAVFMVVIACINFMNLSTARSANRAKEVGVRKTIGAFRSKLIGQFLSESMLYSVISTVLALVIIALMMGEFNQLSGKSLTIFTLLNPMVIGGLVGFALFVGVLAGSYPAFYLTSFNPVDVLKGKIRSGFKNSSLRNGLVIFQFMISITLILGSLVVNRQLEYMQQKNLGFDKENIVRLLHTWSLDKRGKAFKTELTSHPEFLAASFADDLPGHITSTSAYRKVGTEQDFILANVGVDYDHLVTMKYEMAQGRFFSRDYPSDSIAVVINEAAFKTMGYTSIEHEYIYNYGQTKPVHMKVIGVVKDFNYESLHSTIRPLVFVLGPEISGALGIRFAKGDVQKQVQLLESIWKKYSTDPFQYSFLDDDFDKLFSSEQRIGRLILIFTVLVISIACLGLFGLATFVGEQRAKEISIRKVMGASIPEMMTLLFKDFTILIVVAFVIAAPLGWYGMKTWLEGFAYRTTIDASVFVIAGVTSLLIAILTISYQSIKAACANPVVALKTE